MTGDISPGAIARIHDVIRPYIRHTPILRVNGGDVGLPPFPLTFKLEFVQHGGSFKARGAAAFAALLAGRYEPSPDEHVAVILCGGNAQRHA